MSRLSKITPFCVKCAKSASYIDTLTLECYCTKCAYDELVERALAKSETKEPEK